jgi:3-dehydroquinate synthetase
MIEIITKDKKRDGDTIQFILLESIGKAVIYPVTIDRLKGLLNDLS